MTGEPFESDGRSPEAGNNTGRESRSKLLKIGRYQVIDQLGQGGMGIVVKASHQELDKLVAIKVLNSNLLVDETSLKRFEIEAKAGSQLAHPSLVSIFDYGVTDDGSPYLVMEYIEGRSLQEILAEQGRLPGPMLVKVFEQIAKALMYIHKRGVVHRDIKASNIMLQDIEGDLYAKLVDFGIAKVIADSGSGQKLTETGSVFGSPFYMSPEQCQGNQVDARSDIYSLGCVMYECYVGNPPIQGENALKTIFMHVTHPPEPLADLNSTNPAARGFAKMIHRCLEKSPNARYQNCSELLQSINEIKEAIESQKYQSPSHSPSAVSPQNRWKRTNPVLSTYTPSGAQTGMQTGAPAGVTGTPSVPLTGAPAGAQSSTAMPNAGEWNTDSNIKGDILLSSARIAALNGKKPNIAIAFFDRAISEYEKRPTENTDKKVAAWLESAELAQKFKWFAEAVRRAEKALEKAPKIASEIDREEFVRRAEELTAIGKEAIQKLPPLANTQAANQQSSANQLQPVAVQSASQQLLNADLSETSSQQQPRNNMNLDQIKAQNQLQ
jgi:Serine/threonine protein kinase